MCMKNIKLRSLRFAFAVLLGLIACTRVWAGSFEDRIQEKIDRSVKELKEKINRLGEDREAIQDYLNKYDWKGIIQDKAYADGVTLKNLKLNGHRRVTVVRPGELIEASVICDLDRKQCSAVKLYRVVIGLKGEGAQTTIGNELGMVAGESCENFRLSAPSKPGIYQVRFRLVESYREGKALKNWEDKEGNEPDARTTIGLLAVKE